MARGRKKKTKLRGINKILYLVFYFVGSYFIFLIVEFLKFLKGSHERIIYKASDFRQKHKPKIFKVKIGARIKILFAFLVIVGMCGFGIWYFIFRGLPSPSELIDRKIDVSTKIYDRNGILLYQIYKDQNRTPVGLTEVPKHMIDATLASEDASFYTNHGFSFKGILRALAANIKKGNVSEGGSTITQQLVKNALLSNERTLVRKLKELVLSIEVDSKFNKDQILEMYLNEVPYGGSSYGIEAASEMYFGKDVSKLDLSESALLAGLTRSPTTYSPFGANPESAIRRQHEVLQLMVENGFISKKEATDAEKEKINFANNQTNIKAPHFVMYVRQKLVDAFGEDEVSSGGLSVITTLDYNMQQKAEEIVEKQVNKLQGLHVTNGAAIVLDPNTGEILAMVGSKDYFDTTNDGNVNVVTAIRPPGSAIKIVNYSYALSHGFTPASIISDSPVIYKFSGSPAYSPVNYDGKFVGSITLRNAFAQSRNVPAVKVLASYGVENMIKMGQEMGITTWNEENTYGLSLTLGGGSTKLIDMARVYATVADLGSRPPIVSIKKVTDWQGNDLTTPCDSESCDVKSVLDPRVAYQIVSILSDNRARAAEFGEHSALAVPNHPEVAVKTGTSNDLRDNLTIGFSQKYLTAVWVGNNDNSPMSRIASGITGAAPIWNEIMSTLLGSEPAQEWAVPQGLVSVVSGCPVRNEWFIDGTQTKLNCTSDATPSAKLKAD